MNKNFRIYRSSAGSGKTYALVRQYIKLALSGDNYGFRPRYFRHILAITFTNKAASEMKERVLTFLSDLKEGKGKGEQHSFFAHIQQDTGLSVAEVQLRATQVLSAVLHHYSDLSISTIDKFVYRIVRTFAHDLELAHNFEVEMDSEKLIQPAVALLISRVGSNEALSNALVDFSLSKAMEGKSYKLEQDLANFSKHLFAEESDKHIQSLKAIGISDCLTVKGELKSDIIAFEKLLLASAKHFESFCSQHALNEKSFYQGDFYRYLFGLKRCDPTKLFPGKRLKASMESDRWYAKTSEKHEQLSIDQNKTFLKELYENLQEHLKEGFKQYVFNKLLLKNIYSIAVLNELSEELDNYKADHNIKHISEFNKAIANIIREEPAPFIYERLGERYKHYLVDEFQDTSVLQWHNLLPLVHHALSIGSENLIVGDAKQSIYRWRGGAVEQFVKLPSDIYKKALLPNGDEVQEAIQRNAVEVPLDSNWRSAKEVVDFNNRFFESLKQKLGPELQKIYEGHSQLSQGGSGGLVRIEFLEKSKTIEADIMQSLITKIQELTSLAYDWKDMAILCRTRKDATTVAYHLNKAGVSVVSDEALLLNTSSEVNLLLSLLHYLHDSQNQIAASDIVHYLHQRGRLKGELNALFSLISEQGAVALLSFLKAAGIGFNPLQLWQLPLYDLVEKLIKEFRLPSPDIYLQFFLDAVLTFSFKKGNDVQAFLEWWEEEQDKEAIVISEDMNAVKVMTVHKSKGLEFPIVFIPFDWSIGKPSKELWVDAQGKISRLKVALLTNSKLLDDSEYAVERQEELDKALLDDLNVLYVAMTRPKQQLYLLTERPSKPTDGQLNKLTKLLQVFLPQHDFNQAYQEGELLPKEQEATKESTPVYQLTYQATDNWRSVVQLKNAAKQIWDVDLEKKEFGTLLHTALSKIHYPSDKEVVLDALKRNGLLNDDLKERLRQRIADLLTDPEVLPFFSEEWEVKTEQEILRKEGDTYIPDRLLFKSKEIQVVDYKTGSMAKKNIHSDQIKNYAYLLRQMGYENVSCYLIYTEENQKVVRVN